MDVEFLVQAFQLKYGRHHPALRTPNTWRALEALRSAGLLTEGELVDLRDAYDFLMRAKSRLRIVHNRALDELPAAPEEVGKLARRLGFEGEPGARFLAELERHTGRTRELFLALMAREREAGRPGEGLTPVGEEPWE